VQVIFDKSPFYVESGGQESDRGWVLKDGMEIEVNRLWARKHFIIHEIEVHGKCFLKRGDTVLLHVDTVNRSKIIRNHSGTHLLNAAVRHLTNSPIFQKSSLVNSDGLKLELAILGKKLSLQDLEILENLLRKNIKEKPLDASVKIINSLELSEEENVLMVPGETYPENGIRLVSFGNQESEIHSKELCCGTHAFNSRELWDFTFLNVKSTGKSSYLFTGMTGQEAEEALEAGNELLNDLVLLKDQVKTENIKNVLRKIQESKSRLSGGEKIAFVKKQGCLEVLEEVNEIIKSENRSALSELLDIEMKELVSKNTDSFIIHNLSCSDLMKSVSLQKATRYVSDRPVMLFSFTEEMIKARCCVPKVSYQSKSPEFLI
jgi:alanyl-tRNA synthetase